MNLADYTVSANIQDKNIGHKACNHYNVQTLGMANEHFRYFAFDYFNLGENEKQSCALGQFEFEMLMLKFWSLF